MALLAAVLISLAALQVTVEQSTCPEEPVEVFLSRGQRVTIRYWVGEGALQEVTELPKVSRRPVITSRRPDDTTPLPTTTLPPTTVPPLHGKIGDESFASTTLEFSSTESTTPEQTTENVLQTSSVTDDSDIEVQNETVSDSVTDSTLFINDTTEVLNARDGVSDAQPLDNESTTLDQLDITTSENIPDVQSTTVIVEENSAGDNTELPSSTIQDSTTQDSITVSPTTKEETSLPDDSSSTTESSSTSEIPSGGLLDRSAVEDDKLDTTSTQASSTPSSEETTVESSTTTLPTTSSKVEAENVYSYVENTKLLDDSTGTSAVEEFSTVKEEQTKELESTAYADSTVSTSTINEVDIVLTAEEFSENPFKENQDSVPALESTLPPPGELTYQYVAGESHSSESLPEKELETSVSYEPTTERISSQSFSTDSLTSTLLPVVSEEITTGETSTEATSSVSPDNPEIKLLERSQTEENFPNDDSNNTTEYSVNDIDSDNNSTDDSASPSVTEASDSTTVENQDSTIRVTYLPDFRIAPQETTEVASSTIENDSSDNENISSVEPELNSTAFPELTTVISDVDSDNESLSSSVNELERRETIPISSSTVSSDNIIFKDTTENIFNSSDIDPRGENETLVDDQDSDIKIIEATTLADLLSTEFQDAVTSSSSEEEVELNSETTTEFIDSSKTEVEVNDELENVSSTSKADEEIKSSTVSDELDVTSTTVDNANSGLVSSIESILHQVLDNNDTSNIEEPSSIRASRNLSAKDEDVNGQSSTIQSLVRPVQKFKSESVDPTLEERESIVGNEDELDIVPLYGEDPQSAGHRRGPDKLPSWYLPDYTLLRVDHAPYQPYHSSYRYHRSTRLTREIKKNSTKCEWIFKTEPGVPLLLTFKNFSTPEAERCIEHHIAVERSNGFEARWCGISGENPGHATFARHEIKLRLYSEEGTIRFPTGFVAEVQALDMNLLRKALASDRPLHRRPQGA